jgi:serine/threonine-protein kinase
MSTGADIWAFGVVLYELLTGKQLFQGEDLTDTLASVVKVQPDLRAAPEQARRVLQACLEKDPKKRLQAIGDVQYLVGSTATAPAEVEPRPKLAVTGWIAAGVLAIVAAAGLWAPWRSERPAAGVARQARLEPLPRFPSCLPILMRLFAGGATFRTKVSQPRDIPGWPPMTDVTDVPFRRIWCRSRS